MAEIYYDGYTATCVDNTEDREGYKLSIQQGGMPPFFLKSNLTLEQVVAEMVDSPCPQPQKWGPIEAEEN